MDIQRRRLFPWLISATVSGAAGVVTALAKEDKPKLFRYTPHGRIIGPEDWNELVDRVEKMEQ